MTKSKSGKPSSKSQFIDMKEITETLDTNEEVIKNLIHNYNNNMVKVGNKKATSSKS